MNKHVTKRLKDIVLNNFQKQIKSVNLDLLDLKGYTGTFVWKVSEEGTLLTTLDTPISFLFYEAMVKQEPNECYYYSDGFKVRKISRNQALRKVLEQCEKFKTCYRVSA